MNNDPVKEVNSDLPRVVDDGPAHNREEPVSLRALLTRPVVVSVVNYGVIALLDMTAGILISLIWSTPVEFGGLSMSPASVGLWTAGYGIMNCIFQFVAFPGFVKRFGARSASILCYFPIFIVFPFENLALRGSISRSLNPSAELLMVLQLSAASFAAMRSGTPSQHLALLAATEVIRIDKVRYLCSYQQPPPISGPSALRTDSRRQWCRFSARLDQLLPHRCLHSHWNTTSWVEILCM